jgi:hypothetical protein
MPGINFKNTSDVHPKSSIIKHECDDLVGHLLPTYFQKIDQVNQTVELNFNFADLKSINDVFHNKLLNLERILKLDLVDSFCAFVALIIG